jgi:hypothetical protein
LRQFLAENVATAEIVLCTSTRSSAVAADWERRSVQAAALHFVIAHYPLFAEGLASLRTQIITESHRLLDNRNLCN